MAELNIAELDKYFIYFTDYANNKFKNERFTSFNHPFIRENETEYKQMVKHNALNALRNTP